MAEEADVVAQACSEPDVDPEPESGPEGETDTEEAASK